MHVRNLFTVMAFLAIGAVSLPTPQPNGDVYAATEQPMARAVSKGSKEDVYSNMKRAIDLDDVRQAGTVSADGTYNGGILRERRDEDITGALAGGVKREEAITADKSYNGEAEKRAVGATSDNSYNGGEEKRAIGATSDKSYNGGEEKRAIGATSDKSYNGEVEKRAVGVTSDQSYNGAGGGA